MSPDPDTAGAAVGEVLGGATSAEVVANKADEVEDALVDAEPDGAEVPAADGSPGFKEASPDPDAAGAVEVLKTR